MDKFSKIPPRIRCKPGEGLQGRVRLPGDKSISHRTALLAAMAEGSSSLDNYLKAGVTMALLNSLQTLGVKMAWTGEGDHICLEIEGRGCQGWAQPEKDLYCGNSATTIRLLAGALVGVPPWQKDAPERRFTLRGSEQLERRPMSRLVEPLRAMSASILGRDGKSDQPPLDIIPQRLKAACWKMPVASAQVKSAILLAGLYAEGETQVQEPAPSRDHTERLLQALGVTVIQDVGSVSITPISQPLQPLRLSLPGDFSSAAFLMVAASIIPGSDIILENVGLNPGRTGLLETLRAMGGNITILEQSTAYGEPCGTLRIRYARLEGTEVKGDMVVRMIDEFPIFGVAAACAKGKTVVSQAEELRHKESDRIGVLCAELRKLHVSIEENTDGFIVSGSGKLKGTEVTTYGDHRLAMSLSVAGLMAAGETVVEGTECISESYPGFLSQLVALGATIDACDG